MSYNKLDFYKSIKPAEAKKLQMELRRQISLDSLQISPQHVAGADISCNKGSNKLHAAVIVLKLPELKPVARSLVSDTTGFPYIPGLLAFREMPVLLKAWSQLQIKPDVLILDGHGIAHPRRMGIATHFGIEVDAPTMGCAKKVLTGSYGTLGSRKGDYVSLMDEQENVGLVVRSRTDVNPIFISPGYKLSLEDAYAICMKVLTHYKLPETTRFAHRWANKLRKGEVEQGYYEYESNGA